MDLDFNCLKLAIRNCTMSERSTQIGIDYFFHDMTQREIAAVHHISRTKVQEIIKSWKWEIYRCYNEQLDKGE